MKYINEFEKVSDFQAFMDENGEGGDALISYIVETQSSVLKPYVPKPRPILAGDVAYWDGSKVKTTPLNNWDISLGTAIGVVVVPEGFAPDGKVRIVNLMNIDKEGKQTDSINLMYWGGKFDTSLTNYHKVPITNNNENVSSSIGLEGSLPSDSFTGTTSFVDPKAKYNETIGLIPSPYLGDSPNPEYYKTVDSYGDELSNVLSDFNGLENTEYLVSLGSDYEAANACWKYKDGVSNLQWYLPGVGELGYLMVRFNEINNTINTLEGTPIVKKEGESQENYLHSSSEKSDRLAYTLFIKTGWINVVSKGIANYVRPFAII